MAELSKNLGGVERFISTLLGAGFALLALRQGARSQRVSAGVTGMTLLTRGVTGYCVVKDAFTASAQRLSGPDNEATKSAPAPGTAKIDSLQTLYFGELRELRSAEVQLQSFLPSVRESFPSSSLEQVLSNYALDVQTRIAALDQVIADSGASGRHFDGAMFALITETRKMAQIDSAPVRGAALLASLQRLIHFMIAGYGTVATYATTLDRAEEAERFHGDVEREKEIDQQLTALAKAMTNPEARAQ